MCSFIKKVHMLHFLSIDNLNIVAEVYMEQRYIWKLRYLIFLADLLNWKHVIDYVFKFCLVHYVGYRYKCSQSILDWKLEIFRFNEIYIKDTSQLLQDNRWHSTVRSTEMFSDLLMQILKKSAFIVSLTGGETETLFWLKGHVCVILFVSIQGRLFKIPF